jgi:hypothetical protein
MDLLWGTPLSRLNLALRLRRVSPWTYGNSGNSGMLSSPPSAVRSRRVVLTPIVVHAIDAALDGVLAHATLLVTARPEAGTGMHEDAMKQLLAAFGIPSLDFAIGEPGQEAQARCRS